MPLPTPGTPSFLPLLIDHLLTSPQLRGWNFDPTLLSVLLIALIVRRGGVIVDVLRDDKRASTREGVERVVSVISAMSESIFGRPTHHAKLSPDSEPEDVSRSILYDPHAPRVSKSSRASSRYASAASSPPLGIQSNQTPEPLHCLEGPKLKLPETLVISCLETAPSPAQIKLLSTLSTSRLEMDGVSYTPPEGWMTIWVRDAERPDVPSWVVDHFSCSTSIYPEDLDLPPLGIDRDPLIRPRYIANLTSLLPYTHLHPPLHTHISNLLSALSLHPRLRSTLTARATLTFPDLVRAHRLLSSPFSLPPSWEEGLAANSTEREEEQRVGLGGGPGGVDIWGRRAGEAPEYRTLRGGGGGRGGGGEERGGEDWYAGLRDVEGAWGVGVRHRVRWREAEGEVMWLLKGGAGEMGLGTGVGGGDGKERGKGRDRGRGRRREVEGILEGILRTV